MRKPLKTAYFVSSLLLAISTSGCATLGCDWMVPGSYAYSQKCVLPAVQANSQRQLEETRYQNERHCALYEWCGQHRVGPVVEIRDQNGALIGTAIEE